MILREIGASISIDINYSKSSKSVSKQLSNAKSKAKYDQKSLNQDTCICFLLMMQVPLHYLITFTELLYKFGTILVFLAYLLLVLFIGMPLYMIIISMGQYCRKGFIKFWQCIPLLKGMGYSIAGMLLLQEVVNCSLVGMCVLFLPDILFYDLPWKNCKFNNATKTCVSMVEPNKSKLSKCQNMSLDVLPTFSTQNYYKYNKLQLYPPLYTSELGPVNTNLAIAITVIWISISIFMIIGFKRFQKIFIRLLQFIVLASLLIFVSTLFISRKYHPGNKLYVNIYSVFDFKFWLLIFHHVCARTEPGTAIYFTSITNSSLKPNVVAAIVYGLKLVVLVVIMLWFPLLVQNILNHYNVEDPSCFEINGFDILFAVIPDVLSRMPVPKLWLLLWFLIIINLGYVSIVFTCTATIDSLIDAHPFLKIYRTHLCVILCCICCAINMLFVTPLSMVIINTWRNCGMKLLRMVILTMVTFSLIFIYSLLRISTDYHFAYEQPVGNFWIHCWKILPFLILFQTVFVSYNHKNMEELKYSNSTITYSTYFVALFVLLPIFIVMLWIYSKHVKHQTVSTIVKSESDWGHYNVNKSAARYRFNPNTEVRYKTKKLKCKHDCLIYSRKLKKLQQLTNIKKALLLTKAD